MPVPFEMKSGAFQARFPDVWLVGMMYARDPAEPLGIPCTQSAGDRELAQIAGVRHTEIEGGIFFRTRAVSVSTESMCGMCSSTELLNPLAKCSEGKGAFAPSASTSDLYAPYFFASWIGPCQGSRPTSIF